jgi:Asp-tRNA(Asn)/Glu-tRNA(Gln) amidotransferase A subunit family amidase
MPAISIPSGIEDGTGLPFGIQMTADLGREHVLFALGEDFAK